MSSKEEFFKSSGLKEKVLVISYYIYPQSDTAVFVFSILETNAFFSRS